MSSVTYTIELNAENMEKIRRINEIITETATSAALPVSSVTVANEVAVDNVQAHKPLETPKPVEDNNGGKKRKLSPIREALRDARKDYTADFITDILDYFGAGDDSMTPTQRVNVIPEENIPQAIRFLTYGPVVFDREREQDEEEQVEEQPEQPEEEQPEEEEDFGFDDEKEVTAKSVKTAIISYREEKGKDAAVEILRKHRLPNLKALLDVPQDKLCKIMQDVI